MIKTTKMLGSQKIIPILNDVAKYHIIILNLIISSMLFNFNFIILNYYFLLENIIKLEYVFKS